MKKILFVCLGNICRSPAAEAIMNDYIEREGMIDVISCDSAGILDYHRGEPADKRMKWHARKRGYNLTSISRPVNPSEDFDSFDMIIGMDQQNVKNLKEMARSEKHLDRIYLITDFLKNSDINFVPDPYFGGDQGFEQVLDILEDACKNLFDLLRGEN
jgi:protein-tyrosine phosphatase